MFLGDAVGYYDEPNFVCDFLRDRANYAIAGNHDRYVKGQLNYPSERESKYRIQWTKSQLTPRNLQWLDDLPGELSLHLDQTKTIDTSDEKIDFRLVHLATAAQAIAKNISIRTPTSTSNVKPVPYFCLVIPITR